MSIVDTRKMLLEAQQGHYAVGAFNVENMEFVQAVVAAAEELQSPVMLATSVNTLKYGIPELFYSMVNACAEKVSVPVAIHLDHGEGYLDIISVIRGGYKSVMFDGSKRPYIENLNETKKITELCHHFDISVEGELGAIGGKPGTPKDLELLYTKPSIAADFAEKTNVDSLAVAIGTAHGIYKSTPRLDYDRLQQIRDVVSVPLVLHGASGLSDVQLQICIECGICKVNIATELRIAWTDALKKALSEQPDKYDPKFAARLARDAVKSVVKEKIMVLGSAGKSK